MICSFGNEGKEIKEKEQLIQPKTLHSFILCCVYLKPKSRAFSSFHYALCFNLNTAREWMECEERARTERVKRED
jgi:hypothetical protein